MSQSQNQITPYIGIAFYSTEGFPTQLVIVLSNRMQFETIDLYGTVIDSVNGWVESWRRGGNPPTLFEPYLKLVGILTIGQVDKSPNHISSTISSMGWKLPNACLSPDRLKHPYSNDYVCRALQYLCSKNTITLPHNIKIYLDGHITTGLDELRKYQESRPDLFSIISLPGGRDPVFFRIV